MNKRIVFIACALASPVTLAASDHLTGVPPMRADFCGFFITNVESADPGSKSPMGSYVPDIAVHTSLSSAVR